MGYKILDKDRNVSEYTSSNSKEEYVLVCDKCLQELEDINKDEKFYCVNENCECNIL